MNAKNLFLLSVTILLARATYGQASVASATMDFKLAPAKAVLGAPFEGEYHLVWDATVTLPMKPCGNDPNLWIEVRLPNGNSKGWATGTVPAALPIRAPVTIEKGQPVGYSIGYSNIVETTCAPGLYGVRLRYRVNTGWNNYDAFWKGEAVSNWANIEITAPEGEDAAIWTRFRAQVPEGACWDFHRWAVYHGAEILVSFPASTYAGYAIAKKLIDLSDWRFKVGTPASAIQAGKEHPEWATRSQSDVDLFNLVEKHIQGGNTPESLRAVLYCYYGEQLILRGRTAEAETAFCQAVKEKPADAKGEAYFTRAQQFLDALGKKGP